MSLAKADPETRSARRGLISLFAALVLSELLLVLLLAGVIDRLTSGADGVMMPLLAASGIAAMSGAGLLLLFWVAEDFAQDSAGTREDMHP